MVLEPTTLESEKSPEKASWLTPALLGSSYCVAILQMLSIPPILVLLIGHFKITHAEAGLMMSAFFIAHCFDAVPGALSDRFGAKPLVVAGLGVASLAGLGSTFAPTYLIMVIMRVGIGLGMTTLHTPALKGLFYSVPRERVALGATFFYIAATIGSAIPLVATLRLAEAYGWQFPLRLYAACGLLVTLIGFLYIENDGGRKRSFRIENEPREHRLFEELKEFWSILTSGSYLLTLGGMTMFMIAGTSLVTWLPAFLIEARGYTSVRMGGVMLILEMVRIPFAFLAGWIAVEGRMVKIAVVGLLFCSASFIMIPFLPGTLADVTLATATFGVGHATVYISILSLIRLSVHERHAGKALGLAYTVGFLSSSVATYLAGYIITRTRSYLLVFVLLAAASLIASILLALNLRIDRRSFDQLTREAKKSGSDYAK